MKIITGGITRPKGFQANGVAAGIKASGKLDLSLIYSTHPCQTAAVFTKNSIKAAPLRVTKKHLAHGRAQAILTNSGNANCFTGSSGLAHAKAMATVAAQHLKLNENNILVSSTGIIGKPLPIEKIKEAVPVLTHGLGASLAKGTAAAQAIMTTDTFIKQTAVTFFLNKTLVTIGGCAKGSGMIEPNMATMLAYITTDAAISTTLLKRALHEATDQSFNSITVDGCMSTNDMAIVMANGMAGHACLTKPNRHFQTFCQALTLVCLDLAQKIVEDGEGSKKLMRIHVTGAPNVAIAKKAAKSIANSNLVKTAAYGKNANWGRIAAAVGSLGLNITEDDLTVTTAQVTARNITIDVDLGKGRADATVLTCDLTEDYIKINGSYN